MGGDDEPPEVPFDQIVRRGALQKQLEERRQRLEDQAKLTLQDVSEHNQWLALLERDLTGARTRIEREFKITSALATKVHEPRRRIQLQQRLDALRQHCD